MLTNDERELFDATGQPHLDRWASLICALNAEADSAKVRDLRERDRNPHLAAAMGGKALAYRDAARMVQHILDGHSLHPRKYSVAMARLRAFRARRIGQDQAVPAKETQQ